MTNLVQSSTATNCAGWQTFSKQGDDAKPTILYSGQGGQSSVGSKHLSYTFFDNLHPQYMVVDGLGRTHFYESNDLTGPKFGYAPGTTTYEGGSMQDTTCGGGEKTTLNYWNVGDCLHRGYDKVMASLEAHVATLPSSTFPSPSQTSLSRAPAPSSSSSSSSSPTPSPTTAPVLTPSSSPEASPSNGSTACIEPASTVGSLNTSVAALTTAPAFGVGLSALKNATATTHLQVIVGREQGKFAKPRDLQWHPLHPTELWVTNADAADVSILSFDAQGELAASERLADRAKYHYMSHVSSLAFATGAGRFATCQESTNTYDGLTARAAGERGNRFMGPTLFDSDPAQRVTSMGKLCTAEQLLNNDTTCFLRHIDMLHESPNCMGIVHDPEAYKCGSGSVQKNVFFAFDGWGKDDQAAADADANTARTGMLMRYDFERDHGGCNTYLCADHGEAEVRRYEDVLLTREPGVVSHMAIDAHRDLYIADSGARRLLRVDVDSGRSARSAIYDFPIYSSTHLHFNYKMWSCTMYEVLVDGSHPGLMPADRGDNFMPAGVAQQGGILYVSNFVSGNILAIDTYTGDIVATIETGRMRALAGITLKGDHLYVLDQVCGELLRVKRGVAAAEDEDDGGGRPPRPARPYPNSPVCNATAFEEPTVGDAIEHDPGYMNIAIPYDYGGGSSPCHDPQTNRSLFNLDALLMAGHTCHRCLPEPCQNGGTCTGQQEAGFTCRCPEGFAGDVCQIRESSPATTEANASTDFLEAVASISGSSTPSTKENSGQLQSSMANLRPSTLFVLALISSVMLTLG